MVRSRSRFFVVFLVVIFGFGCDEKSSEPAAGDAPEANAQTESDEDVSPSDSPLPSAPEELPAVAADDFQPPCLAITTDGRRQVPVPPQLTELVAETHADSTLVRLFAREGRVPPTATGHEPTGHVFRWTLREAIGEPRERFRNDQFRGRLAVIAAGVPLQEGFENRQVRTIEVRLRTQGPVEQVMTVLNSKAEGRPSTASQSCVDHGPLPDLTLAHFARWGWLPPELAELAERVPEARVERLRTAPAEAVFRGDAPIRGALEDWDGGSLTELEGGSLRISASAASIEE